MSFSFKQKSVLPGFGPSLGYTVFYLSLVVLIPLSALVVKSASLSWPAFMAAVSAPRVMASYRLTFGAALLAALVNALFGVLVAWVLVRYRFPGKKIIDALVDLPFALPTAVAGITLASLYSANGWLGRYLEPLGIKVAYTPLGIMVAMVFIGLPFVVRTVQPVLEELESEIEEAAACLGANRWQTFTRVIFPIILPSVLTGFALAFARGGRRVRLDYFHRRQHADGLGNNAAFDPHQAGAVRLRGSNRHRLGDAGSLVPDSLRHQHASAPEQAAHGTVAFDTGSAP